MKRKKARLVVWTVGNRIFVCNLKDEKKLLARFPFGGVPNNSHRHEVDEVASMWLKTEIEND